MQKFLASLKQYYWPISALIFCPCHLPLTMSAVASLTAGTAIGAYISTYYSSIETVLAVTFSFYFVLAFMIWIVRGPQHEQGTACKLDSKSSKQLSGLSTKQIIVWGIIGMLLMPALVSISVFTEQSDFTKTLSEIFAINPEFNSGFIWLISLSTVVMIPVMVIWLVWMWLAWAKVNAAGGDKAAAETWSYEYD